MPDIAQLLQSGGNGWLYLPIIHRMTGVPSRGAALIGDQSPFRGSIDMVGRISSLTAAIVCRPWIGPRIAGFR
ncbi:hypothetical protein BB934_29390 (plasmid) [Microvirga ossetica]|uniref:Uncharacterized protein n=1 Tax=Microvirga ossetica TaxID=1882682 RepID=A0A1B2ER05_9HYPH|nr:hypothetical protein BB934_29390 [Microvirga ossetica]